MEAIVQDRYGDALLTRVVGRSIGFGMRRPAVPNPGGSFAGTVAEVGTGVTGLGVGDDVHGSAGGSFAEYVVAPAGLVARKPATSTPSSPGVATAAARDSALNPRASNPCASTPSSRRCSSAAPRTKAYPSPK